MMITTGGWQHRVRSSAWRSKKTDQDVEAMGKFRGGLSTKIHAAVDAMGNPVRLQLGGALFPEAEAVSPDRNKV
ncbi:hypothetical protein ACN1C3_04365 [Pseudomonas sp. H11T01]|uniref:hypothetical protein n=1 Tax=Pseudomonas sp. H11T01 TaxID=3402749 RepID=UPI003ACB9603